MVHINILAGLGNQLFQIATGYAYAIRHGYGISISTTVPPDRPVYWNNFLKKCAPMLGSSTHTSKFMKLLSHRINSTSLWREPHFHYCPIPPNMSELYGYFQSSKYFADISGEIRNLFRPSDEIMAVVKAKYGPLLKNPNICVVHIRRTDYMNTLNAPIHVVCHETYYLRALEKMDTLKPGVEYLVFSDDLEWCKKQDTWWKDRTVTFVDETTDYIALSLMSQFNAFIISNSTFSWWATWLREGGKTVIAPDRWFGTAGPKNWEDIYEPGWIRISTV